MDNMPVIGFFLKYLNAIILHINQGCFCKKLISQYCHIRPELYAWTAEIIVLGKKFSFNRIQESNDTVITFHPIWIRPIKISKTML